MLLAAPASDMVGGEDPWGIEVEGDRLVDEAGEDAEPELVASFRAEVDVGVAADVDVGLGVGSVRNTEPNVETVVSSVVELDSTMTGRWLQKPSRDFGSAEEVLSWLVLADMLLHRDCGR